MFKCLHYDNRQSTVLCRTQHHTVGTYFLFRLDSLSVFFYQQICTAHILSFGLFHELLCGFFWVLGPVLDSQLTFDTSSHLSGTYPTLTKQGLVVIFADFVSFSTHIPEYTIVSSNVKKEPKYVPVPHLQLSVINRHRN